jgi:transcriptional regulator with XRE-family HTH domain
MILSEQCRAARALLGWSQDDLERHSKVPKKTIADFERGARSPRTQTNDQLQRVLEASGIVFIPQNGGGAGVRLRIAIPHLFRRDDVPQREWVAFAFDYRDRRIFGFVMHDALLGLGGPGQRSVEVFDAERDRILIVAGEKHDRGDYTVSGYLILDANDLPPLECDDGGDD